MFTGIIEAVGTVSDASRSALTVETTLDGLAVGDSLAVNGVCLTVVDLRETTEGYLYSFDVSEETMRVTSLASLVAGSRANLERAMAAGGRFGGHIVQGHVDGVAEVAQVVTHDGSTEMFFEVPEDLAVYLVPKGSVAVDGVSLTVAALTGSRFSVALIPHTLQETNLSDRKVGDQVNVEADILAKYVERLYRKEH